VSGEVLGVFAAARDITERNKAEQEVTQLSLRNRQILDSAGEGIYGLDIEGRCTFVNPAALQLLGFSADELLNQHSHSVFHHTKPDGQPYPENECPVQAAYKQGMVHRGDDLYWRKDGRNFPVEFISTPILESGTITGAVVAFRDITERKQAEEALRSLTFLQRTILDNVAYGIISTNPDGVVTSFNFAAERLLGYTANEVVGQQTPACWHDSEEIARNALQLSEELGTPIAAGFEVFAARPRRNLPEENEWTYIRKDGRRIPVSLSVTALRDESSQVTGFVGLAYDLTERKQAEETVELNAQRVQALLQLNQMAVTTLKEITDFTLQEAVLLTQSKIGYLAFLNEDESVLTMNSWSKSAMAECAINEKPIIYPVVSTGLWGEAVRQRRPVITNDYSAANPLKKGYPEGHVHIKRHMNVPVFDGDRIVIVAGVGNKDEEYNQGDVQQLTLLMEGMWRLLEHKRAEEELRRYKDHLEDVVQQRTADLALALDAAEAANRAKSVFLSSMSHELRTPMNAILGFSGMMRKDPLLSQEQRDNLDIINRSGDHLLTLINDVLDMAKIEAGRVQLESAPIDLGVLLRDVTDMMHMRAQERGLELLIDQSSEFPRYIKGDEMRLCQVLINLIGNAVKFTEHGSITLRLGVESYDGVRHLLIKVEDTGIGIRPEDQLKIFKPFVQLGKMATQTGSGLGLALTQQYVQLMGGTVSVESTFGKGSIFQVKLPLEEIAAVDVVAKLGSMDNREVVSLAPNQPEYRILIVEDQLDNQLLLTKLMKNVGFQVKVADDGKQAVELFQSWLPHLIWMDRRMPVMDGLEATRRIRELPGGKEVKIVAVTASVITEQRDEMVNAGMDEFVRKPYRFNEIYECMARQLGVQYIYADVREVEEVIDVVLTAEMLAALPLDLRRELHEALESLEDERIAATMQQVASYDPTLHKTLSRLVENFNYPAILKALQTNQAGSVT
jgi:PAS domain S-box-containing protein